MNPLICAAPFGLEIFIEGAWVAAVEEGADGVLVPATYYSREEAEIDGRFYLEDEGGATAWRVVEVQS